MWMPNHFTHFIHRSWTQFNAYLIIEIKSVYSRTSDRIKDNPELPFIYLRPMGKLLDSSIDFVESPLTPMSNINPAGVLIPQNVYQISKTLPLSC
jgi:hypothetical protein